MYRLTMIQKTVLYIILICLSSLVIFPFLWVISTSFKGTGERIFYPIRLIPEHFVLDSYVTAWTKNGFAGFTWNSILVTVMGLFLSVFISVTAAYAFARFAFIGKKLWFGLILLTLIVPFQVIMVSLYQLSVNLNLQNTYLGVVLPFAVNAFYIFFIRQAYMAIPAEIEESARIDGCGEGTLWVRLMLPLIAPAVSTLAIFSFVAQWNEFLWPLIILSDYEMFTLPLGMSYLMSSFGEDWRVVAAGAVIVLIPIMIFYLLMQRYFLSGLMSGAVKG